MLRVGDDAEALVHSIKRNIQTMQQAEKLPRLVMPLEIEGRNNEGARAVAQFASGGEARKHYGSRLIWLRRKAVFKTLVLNLQATFTL